MTNTKDSLQAENKSERIAKRIARAGLCSRRKAEILIGDGVVSVNGKLIDTPATLVNESDLIKVNGKSLPEIAETVLYRFHKPAGLVTTASDEKGRKTVFDALPDTLGRVISVGRLDLNTEGLLLLTNDGGLARYMELPKTAWSRRYRVRAYGILNKDALKAMKRGVEVDGMRYGPVEVEVEQDEKLPGKPANHWLSVTIREGKNREIRKVMESVGLQVNRLIRISYGPFQLGTLSRGKVEMVSGKALKQSLPKNWKSKI